MISFKFLKRCIGTQEVLSFLKNNRSGFDSVLRKVNIIQAENGTCVGEMVVEEEHTNPFKGLHGGLMATLVDSLTSYALLTHAKSEGVPSVSVNLNMTYIKSVNLGEVIEIKAETLRAGRTLGFTECIISNKKTGDIVAKGSHTKFLMRNDR